MIIGIYTGYPNRVKPAYEPFRILLEESLHIPVGLQTESHICGIAKALEKGEIDLFLGSPYPVLLAAQRSGSDPVYEIIKKGSTRYFSVIFTRKDSGIKSLEDLRGHDFVFSTAESTAGYALPRATLIHHGMQVEDNPELFDSKGVHALFSGDSESTMFWVLEKKGDAGALSNEYYSRFAGKHVDELEILARTGETPAGLVCFSPAMSPSLREKLKNFFSNLSAQPEIRKKLESFRGVTGFRSLTPESLGKIRESISMDSMGS